MTLLEIYKNCEKNYGRRPWEIATAFTIFNSVDSFLDNPTEEEYQQIYEICYEVYMESEDVDLVSISDKVSEMYYDAKITLPELKTKSVWEILNLIGLL